MVLGLSLMVAVLHAHYRDVEPVLAAALLPWFFLTPIFLRVEDMPGVDEHPWVGDLLQWANPVAPFIEAVRDVLFLGRRALGGHAALPARRGGRRARPRHAGLPPDGARPGGDRMSAPPALRPGEIVLEGASRSFELARERRRTLKELFVRRAGAPRARACPPSTGWTCTWSRARPSV